MIPCPFCDGAPRLIPTDVADYGTSWIVWRVGCTNPDCLALGPTGGQGPSGESRAIERWDKRSKTPTSH